MHPTNTWMGPITPLDLFQSPQDLCPHSQPGHPTTRFFTKITSNAPKQKTTKRRRRRRRQESICSSTVVVASQKGFPWSL
jgi:hypothetical protein